LRYCTRAPPVLSRVEGPALSYVEGPVLSYVEGPVLSDVEGPVLSDVEGPRPIARSGKPEEFIVVREFAEVHVFWFLTFGILVSTRRAQRCAEGKTDFPVSRFWFLDPGINRR